MPPTYYPQQPTCQIRNAWVLYDTFLGRREDGFFVEVGAFDGVTYSNTWGLAERGWQGLLIEPVPAFAAAARAAHAGHPRVEVVQTAIGAESGTVDLALAEAFTSAEQAFVDLWEAWSHRRQAGKVRVPVRTLDEVLDADAATREIDVLVVDVEGREAEVMAGFSWTTWPKLILLELPDLNASGLYRAHAALAVRDDLLDRGYSVAYKDEVNTVFVRADVWERAWR